MIVGISIRNFKGIQSVENLSLDRFHVLVGPNGSGKSTFLDAIDFVRDCIDNSPLAAVENRNLPEFADLTIMRRGGNIEFEFWMDFDDTIPAQSVSILHYKLSIREDDALGVCVNEETLSAYPKSATTSGDMFELRDAGIPKKLVGKTATAADYYQRENGVDVDSFVFGMDKLALALVPPDEERFPTANAVKRFLLKGTRYIQLNSRAMRLPCPATRGTELELDGTNLARVVGKLMKGNGQTSGSNPSPLLRWTEHLRYAIPDLAAIEWGKREADNAEYVVLRFENGLVCPSWLLSDGTLRMLALTLPAFLENDPGIYMVEEPENGVHPKALEIIIAALAGIPRTQMLVATHSPFVVQQVGIESLLCFSSKSDGTHIEHGSDLPIFKEWTGTPDLATIFAAGVLG